MTAQDHTALVWLETFLRTQRRRPTRREAAARLNAHPSEWSGQLERLERQGMVRVPGSARSVTLTERGLAEATRYRLGCCEGHPVSGGEVFWQPCLACGEAGA